MQTITRHSDPQGDTPQMKSFTISQVARLTGINAKAIRYYESIGLLPCLLRRIRLLGVPLAAAKSLLVGATDARCIDVQQELLTLVKERLKAIDQEIAELQQLRAEVESYQHDLATCQPDESEPFRTCRDMSCIAVSDETQ